MAQIFKSSIYPGAGISRNHDQIIGNLKLKLCIDLYLSRKEQPPTFLEKLLMITNTKLEHELYSS